MIFCQPQFQLASSVKLRFALILVITATHAPSPGKVLIQMIALIGVVGEW